MKMLLRTCLLLMVVSLSLAGFGQAPVSAADAAKATSSSSDKAAATPKANRKAKKAKHTTEATAPLTPAAMSGDKTSAPTPASGNAASPAESAAPVAPRSDDATAPSGNGGATITANPAEVAPVVPITTVSFSESTFDFGKIKQGETVKHKFTITNTGTNPLILENVKPSCGCTALEWPKEPIAPGKSGDIEAQFNSTGKSGAQLKNITITLNTAEHLERLTFTGEVIAPPVDPNAPAVTPASSGH